MTEERPGRGIRLAVKRGLAMLRFDRCFWLLASLVALVLAGPLLGNDLPATLLHVVLLAAVLLSGIRALGRSVRVRLIGWLLAAPFVLSSMAYVGWRGRWVVLVAVSIIPFFVYATYVVLRYVMRPGPVTRDRLFAAASAYFLVGFTWSGVYATVDLLLPGSFASRMELLRGGDQLGWGEFVYYSFVTLTTLGYGDLTPVSQFAMSLSILEAVSGVWYLAVLVARLVAAYTVSDE